MTEKKDKNKRETVGKISTDLLAKSSDKHTVVDQMKEQLSEYEKHAYNCVETHKNRFIDNFYVTVITKKEKLTPNVIRHYFLARQSCPTPDYDQTVYIYNRIKDELQFLWVIPSKYTCLYLMKYRADLPQEEWALLKFVLDYNDGTLFRKAKELNGEKPDTPELIKA